MTSEDVKDDKQAACDIENFKLIASHFRQDLREFWNRANFYLLTNGGLLSAFLIVYPSLVKEDLGIVFVIPVIGLVIAILWFLVLHGALHWIEQWRAEIIRLSDELDRFKCYARVESQVQKKRCLSPSQLTQILPLAFVAAWSLLLLIVVLKLLSVNIPINFRI